MSMKILRKKKLNLGDQRKKKKKKARGLNMF